MNKVKLLKILTKKLKSPYFWAFQIFIYGIIFGIPFIVAGKNWWQYMKTLLWWQGVLIFVGTFLIGLFVEAYLRKIKVTRR